MSSRHWNDESSDVEGAGRRSQYFGKCDYSSLKKVGWQTLFAVRECAFDKRLKDYCGVHAKMVAPVGCLITLHTYDSTSVNRRCRPHQRDRPLFLSDSWLRDVTDFTCDADSKHSILDVRERDV